jgi:hypothetical protein
MDTMPEDVAQDIKADSQFGFRCDDTRELGDEEE